jgi:hypothetical protein
MNTKLTLRLNEHLIEAAKQYAARNGKSVSRLVADYFSLLAAPPVEDETRLAPHVRSLFGILKNAAYADTNEAIADYRRHLEEKYR